MIISIIIIVIMIIIMILLKKSFCPLNIVPLTLDFNVFYDVALSLAQNGAHLSVWYLIRE